VANEIVYAWRGGFADDELDALHAEGFGHEPLGPGWLAQLDNSYGWVTARDGATLVGFVNVAWDGGVHAFLLDTVVSTAYRRRGIGQRLVEVAVEHSRGAGLEWLHVDFEPHLRSFYFDACGFRPTDAGLIDLS
jgi:ribosomal protein S18 acetylase RimI-like enzyme